MQCHYASSKINPQFYNINFHNFRTSKNALHEALPLAFCNYSYTAEYTTLCMYYIFFAVIPY